MYPDTFPWYHPFFFSQNIYKKNKIFARLFFSPIQTKTIKFCIVNCITNSLPICINVYNIHVPITGWKDFFFYLYSNIEYRVRSLTLSTPLDKVRTIFCSHNRYAFGIFPNNISIYFLRKCSHLCFSLIFLYNKKISSINMDETSLWLNKSLKLWRI